MQFDPADARASVTSRRGRAAAFAFVAIVVVGVAGLAWFVLSIVREPALRIDGAQVDAAAATAMRESRGATDGSHGGDGRGTDSGTGANSGTALTAKVDAVEPRLEWPDEASLRQLERRGRALFGGVVYAPDGSPCPGASVWFDGAMVTTTDDHGAWRTDVDLHGFMDFSGFAEGRQLLARKDGVGFAMADVSAPSRRIDLHLEPGLAFSGTVVDFDDATPIGGAELELCSGSRDHERQVVFFTKADAAGRFAFPSLPAGAVYVRGRAPGYDSNGFLGYDFSKGRDVVVAFRLRRQFKLRGRFVPWPCPGIAPDAASVVATTKSPHDPDNRELKFKTTIGGDGRFELPLPICPSCAVELQVESGSLWSTELETNEQRGDLDLPPIELLPAAALTGRIEVSDPHLHSVVELLAIVQRDEGAGLQHHAQLSSDGSFRFAPLPVGRVSLVVHLGNRFVASLQDASGISGDERETGHVLLAPGESRDVGIVEPKGVVVFGTARDPEGGPFAKAQLYEVDRPTEWGPSWGDHRTFVGSTDADGRFACACGDGEDGTERPRARVIDFEVAAHGFAGQHFAVECPVGAHWVRRDLVLMDGVVLRGTLVDESDRPQTGWAIEAFIESGQSTTSASDATRSDGSFEIRGLPEGELEVIAFRVGGGRGLVFKGLHPGGDPVTLRPADAAK